MNRNEIWVTNLDPTIEQEIQKKRPCVIVNDDAIGVLPLRVIVPLTDWKERYNGADWMVKIEADAQNGLTKTSAADCFQVRSLSTSRFSNKIGDLNDDKMKEIEKALATVLKIE
jgi:mRNA interferase MazF